MIVVNTTYHVHSSASRLFFRWLETTFRPFMEDYDPCMMEVVRPEPEPGVKAYALQWSAADMDEAERLEARIDRTTLRPWLGSRLTWFTSFMEEVPL